MKKEEIKYEIIKNRLRQLAKKRAKSFAKVLTFLLKKSKNV